VVIGDTAYDVVAARRAGIDAIVLLSGGFERDQLSSCEPIAIYANVGQLEAEYAQSPLCVDPKVEA
jgi:phosphoglycolate phosphatase-like HAD superfamily hydrolase